MSVLNNQTATQTALYSFTVEQSGDQYYFTYKRAKYGFPVLFGLLFIMGLPLWLVFYWMLKSLGALDVGLMPLWWGLFCTFCFYLLLNRRRKGSFTVSKSQLKVNGDSYDTHHIADVYVHEPETNYTAAMAIAEVIHRVISVMLLSNFSIRFVYGESKVKLAGGLSEASADAMLRKINQILYTNKPL